MGMGYLRDWGEMTVCEASGPSRKGRKGGRGACRFAVGGLCSGGGA